MKNRLPDNLQQKLFQLGQAIDVDQQAVVFDGGEVGIIESLPEKGNRDEGQATRGSAAGSWQGTVSGARGSSSEAARLGVVDQPEVRVAGLSSLRAAYPTITKDVEFGVWIIVTSSPLGHGGPHVTFAIAYPDKPEIPPKGWAFWKLGAFPKFLGPRHTNFPDASICAFSADDGAWGRDDGPLALVDFYSTWTIRQLYLRHFGHWPGRQYGSSALYRRAEFVGGEWCGCGSGARYRDCHEAADKLIPEVEAREEHRRLFRLEYGPRQPPKSVMRFARSNWSKVPDLVSAYEGR